MPAVQPMTVRSPNIARSMAIGENILGARQTRNIAGAQEQRAQVNQAATLEANKVKAAQSRLKFGLGLLAPVNSQETFDMAKEQFLTLVPPDEKEQSRAWIDQTFGTKYDKNKIKVGIQQLRALSEKLSPISVGARGGVYDPIRDEMLVERQPKGEGAGPEGGFAPDMETWRHTKTGKNISVNVRDPQARQLATEAWYTPIGPKARGYLQTEGAKGAQRADEIVGAAVKARSNVVTLESMDRLLDRFDSGKLAGVSKSLQQWGEALGLPIDTTDLSAKEAFKAMTEQLALQSRNMGEGMVLAGQMSDRDVQFLRDMNPQLVISKGGNRLIIKLRKAIAKRNVEVAKFAKEYRDENEGIFDALGFNEFVAGKVRDTSVFGIPDGATVVGTDKVTGLPVYEADGKHYIPNF